MGYFQNIACLCYLKHKTATYNLLISTFSLSVLIKMIIYEICMGQLPILSNTSD